GRGEGEGVPAGRPGAAGDNGARRAHRGEPGEDAAEIDVFLPEVAQRAAVQSTQDELIGDFLGASGEGRTVAKGGGVVSVQDSVQTAPPPPAPPCPPAACGNSSP